MKVLRLLIVLVSCAATPKSASFTSPDSVSRMLPHLMSRCTLTAGEWWGGWGQGVSLMLLEMRWVHPIQSKRWQVWLASTNGAAYAAPRLSSLAARRFWCNVRGAISPICLWRLPMAGPQGPGGPHFPPSWLNMLAPCPWHADMPAPPVLARKCRQSCKRIRRRLEPTHQPLLLEEVEDEFCMRHACFAAGSAC